MRYTVYNPELGKYEVPLLFREDGTPMLITIRREMGEAYTDVFGVVLDQLPSLDYISGDFIDRLAELENMVEAMKEYEKP